MLQFFYFRIHAADDVFIIFAQLHVSLPGTESIQLTLRCFEAAG